MDELQRLLQDFNERAHRIALHYGAQVITTDTSMSFSVLAFYVTYCLPEDGEEPTATPDGSTPDQALALFRDTLAARTSPTTHSRLSLN